MKSLIPLASLALLAAQSPSQGQCPPAPPGAIQWRIEDGGNGNWYRLYPAVSSWNEANAQAQALGGHLVTITSAGERQVVGSLNPPLASAIGLRQVPGSPEPSGGWAWITGEPVDFTVWSPGEPNHDGGEEDCGFTWAGGTWNDGRCHLAANGFIVEWEACDTCPSDISDDGRVDGLDIAFVLSDWGSAQSRSDINGDGAVDGADLAGVLNGWGLCP